VSLLLALFLACGAGAGTAHAELPHATLALTTNTRCYSPGDSIVVEVNLTDATEFVVGAVPDDLRRTPDGLHRYRAWRRARDRPTIRSSCPCKIRGRNERRIDYAVGKFASAPNALEATMARMYFVRSIPRTDLRTNRPGPLPHWDKPYTAWRPSATGNQRGAWDASHSRTYGRQFTLDEPGCPGSHRARRVTVTCGTPGDPAHTGVPRSPTTVMPLRTWSSSIHPSARTVRTDGGRDMDGQDSCGHQSQTTQLVTASLPDSWSATPMAKWWPRQTALPTAEGDHHGLTRGSICPISRPVGIHSWLLTNKQWPER